jgi:hypothetical protein
LSSRDVLGTNNDTGVWHLEILLKFEEGIRYSPVNLLWLNNECLELGNANMGPVTEVQQAILHTVTAALANFAALAPSAVLLSTDLFRSVAHALMCSMHH